MQANCECDAVMSPCRKYRYALTRTWDKEKPTVMFIMLNPSTADEHTDDPTIRRCINYARSWGYGGILVCNLFALRATDPEAMKRHPDPIGDRNDDFIQLAVLSVDKIVIGWGAHGMHRSRQRHMVRMLKDYKLWCFGTTKTGNPKHPLYLPGDITLSLFQSNGEFDIQES